MKQKKIPQLTDFTPNPLNPRTITDERLSALKDAMIEFGDLSGLVVNLTTGNYVGGHQRLKILGDAPITITKRYNKPTQRGTVAEGVVHYDGENFVYREVKWPPEKEKAAMLAANKHGGDWTPDISSLLDDLREESTDMFALTGFDVSELEPPATNHEPVVVVEEDDTSPKAERNAAPLFMKKSIEWRKKWKTEVGQLWEIGPHKLLIGDVFDGESWTLLGDSPYRFGFADPPYELTLSFRPLMQYISGHLFSFLSDDQASCIGTKHLSSFFVNTYGATQGWEGYQQTKAQKHHTLIAHWRAPDAKNVRQAHKLPRWKPGDKARPQISSVIHTESNHDTSGYKSAETHFIKPLEVMDVFMEFYSLPGMVCMDAFAGSGSTTIAAHKRGMFARACELSPDAAAVYLERVTTVLELEAKLT
jgi:16S rRNA G966 N2-methylase RsmD